jgi:hypothetical protein
MKYRVYLTDAKKHFRAEESFSAKNAFEAEEIALALYGNCSMTFHGIELWRGPNLLMRRTRDGARPIVDLQNLTGKRQECVVGLAEMLVRTFECVRESRQLMAALDQIRAAQRVA